MRLRKPPPMAEVGLLSFFLGEADPAARSTSDEESSHSRNSSGARSPSNGTFRKSKSVIPCPLEPMFSRVALILWIGVPDFFVAESTEI